MAMARSSRRAATMLTRLAAACNTFVATSSLSSPVQRSSYLLVPSVLPPMTQRPFSSALPSSCSWRSSMIVPGASPSGMGVIVFQNSAKPPTPCLSSISVRPYSKRPKKWQGATHAFVQVEPGAPCPPYSPNAGSVKKRKHNKRMAQRHAFAKAQAHQRKQETKAALIKRDAARRKRWREGAARALSWAKHLQEQQQAKAVSA